MTFCMFGIAILVASALAGGLLTGFVRALLIRRAILDHPNHRSSHSVPTPRGGGLAVVMVIAVAWAGLSFAGDGFREPAITVLGLALGLAVMSWLDDIKHLSALIRLSLHMAAVGLALTTFDGPILHDALPIWLDRAICFLTWVWFINLFNFMDGIDGISGVQSLTIALGLVAVTLILGASSAIPDLMSLLALGLAGSVIGFLAWNWHPAKIFLGDVGSVPLGFLLGWLLLSLAAEGYLISALCLALYYLVDATWTLLKRAKRGEKIWQAHREHAYQRAVQSGLRHDQVSGIIAIANGVLIIAAVIAALGSSVMGLSVAVVTIIGLMSYLTGEGAAP